MIIRGIDTVEFGLDIQNYDLEFEHFLNELDTLKERSQEEMKEQIIMINNINLTVKKKGQGFYAYKLECDDFHICFMKREIENTSPIYVRFISEFIWKYGYEKAFEVFMSWFSSFHIVILGNRLSRLDICVDTDYIEIQEEDSTKFVTRARKIDKHYVDSVHYIGKQFSGLVIDRGSPLSCRIYNKTLEIHKSNKVWFEEIWKKYDRDITKQAWRVEFQIRRKILKELNIQRYEDVSENISGTWAYLTQKWLTLRIPNNDKNISRFLIDDRWKVVQKANYEYVSSPQIRKSICNGNLEMLLNQCSGLFTSIAAIRNEEKTSNTYLLLLEHMQNRNKKKNTTFKEEVNKKKNRYIKD